MGSYSEQSIECNVDSLDYNYQVDDSVTFQRNINGTVYTLTDDQYYYGAGTGVIQAVANGEVIASATGNEVDEIHRLMEQLKAMDLCRKISPLDGSVIDVP